MVVDETWLGLACAGDLTIPVRMEATASGSDADGAAEHSFGGWDMFVDPDDDPRIAGRVGQ